MIRCFLLSLIFLPTFLSGQVAMEEMKRAIFNDRSAVTNNSIVRSLSKFPLENQPEEFFLFDNWSSLLLVDPNDGTMEADSANFLLDSRKILFYDDGTIMQVFPSAIKSAYVNNRLFKAYKGQGELKDILQFYEVVSEGAFTLLKYWTLDVKNTTNNPMGIPDGSKIEYGKGSELFYFDRKEEMVKMPRKKKDFIKLFGRKKSKMISYASENDLSLKKEKDLIQLVNYYNILMDAEEK